MMEKQQVDNLVLAGIITLVGSVVFFRIRRAKFWSEKGIPAVAHVTKIIDSGMKGHSSVSFSIPVAGAGFSSSGVIWDLYLEIEQPGLPVRRLNTYHRFKDGFDPPQAGDTLPILVHPKNPDKIVFLPRNMAENREE